MLGGLITHNSLLALQNNQEWTIELFNGHTGEHKVLGEEANLPLIVNG
jgi:hypothetical protein